MDAKQLAIISGLALSLSAGSALAQNRGGGTQQDSRDRGTQQDRQERLKEASQALRDRDSRHGSSANVLNSLEGMWKVQVQVNRTNWDLMSSGGRDRGDGSDTGQGRDGANPDTNNPRTDRENEREVRERELRDRQERGQREGLGQDDDRQTSAATRNQDQRMDSADGMARSHPILGGGFLRTTMIFGEGVGSSQRSTDARNREGRGENQGQNQGQGQSQSQSQSQSQMDSSDLQSVSYLGFDEESGEYNLALMTGQSGAIHYLTGKYDQSSRRIIFTSQQKGASSATRQDHPGSTGRQGESSTTRTSTQGASTDGMSVVLQMESGDRYTVTAYRGSASAQSPSGSGMDIGGQPGQRSDRGNDKGQDRSGSLASAAPNVIYKASYTKADERTRSQAESIFEEHDRKERLASRNR